MRRLLDDNRIAVYADVEQAMRPIDIHKEMKKSGCITKASTGDYLVQRAEFEATGDATVPLDFSTWIPFAAPHYHLSPNPDDYIMVPVIIMPTDLPNRNSVGFPLKELIRFHPHLGQQSYKTWKGKPTHREHQNEDITKAYGVIADTFLRKLRGYGAGNVWKVLTLLTFDRSKHADVAASILDGTMNSYSMGAWVSSYTCSYCKAELGKCLHISKDKPGPLYELNGKLVYRECVGIEGFEVSSVGTPAYITALSDSVSELR